MSLRARITALTATAVALSIALVAVLVFLAERREQRSEVDAELRERAAAVATELLASGEDSTLEDDSLGTLPTYAQLVRADGRVVQLTPGGPALAVDARVRAVAAGEHDRFYTDAEADGQRLRVLTVPLRAGALQLAQPLDEVNQHLVFLAGLLAAVTLGGLSMAALLGSLVARSALQPLARLTAGAEGVTATRDLSTRLDVRGTDELSRLAATLNSMLEALEDSQRSRRQLVTDASHELRTPLTSLRTNLEVLDTMDELPERERARLVADLRAELEGLITTVDDLLELASEQEQELSFEELWADRLVEETVTWAAHRYPGVRFRTALQTHLTRANRPLLQRVVGNLLDNAAKWSPPEGVVEVSLEGGWLRVRDQGPGIPAEHLPHVFERFYRAPAARGMPGSGLGLAIVRQIADLHRWRVSAANARGGGSCFALHLAPDSAPTLTPLSSSSHAATVDWDGTHAETACPGRRQLPFPGRLGVVLVALLPLAAAVGAALVTAEPAPTLLRTLTGPLERCGEQLCVGDAVVDFGPPWYLDGVTARYDYDQDGERRLLGEELSGLLGREVTLETDGGPFDEDVFTLEGFPVRGHDGALPAPDPDRVTDQGGATATARPSPAPTSPAPTSPAPVTRTGRLTRCGSGYCLDGQGLDLGPAWYRLATTAPVDLDGDGRRCALATELDALLGSPVEVEFGSASGAEVYRIEGPRYRSAQGEPPWARGPLAPDQGAAPPC